MYTAIQQPRHISAAQNRFLRRIHQALPTKAKNIKAGYQSSTIEFPEVFANNNIWFAYRCLTDAKTPRHWNAFGFGQPALRRSNTITVEINIALDVLSRRVGGLFARDDATGNTVLLHRGRIGGGKKGVGKATFMEWYPDNPVTYSASAHPDLIEPAILLTDLVSDDFLHHLEVFVHRVHQFKSSDRENEVSNLSDATLVKKAQAAPAKPQSSTAVSVTFVRNRYVSELAKRRAGGKCELCRKPAPFNSATGEPYLECHYICWLAHGGADRPENTVALCPNCHQKMHIVGASGDIVALKKRARKALHDLD